MRIYDSADPSRYSEVQVIITVYHNRRPPVFITGTNMSVHVQENTVVGTVICNISAVDTSGQPVVYSLLGTQTAIHYLFINPITGQAFLIQPLDSLTDASVTVGA